MTLLTALPTADAAFPGANGRIVYVKSGQAEATNIFTVGRDGSGVRRLTSTGDAVDPQWSPDGHRILFSRVPLSGASASIWVMGPRGGAKERLLTGRLDPHDAAWAPDGRRIVFTGNAARGTRQLFILSLRSHAVRQVTLPGPRATSATDPAWSPRGGLLAFTRSSPTSVHLFTIRPNGQGLRKVTTQRRFNETDPDFAPGGRRIAYARSVAEAGPTFGVYVVPTKGGSPRKVFDRPDNDSDPAWAPNGRRIVLHSNATPGEPGFRRRSGLWTVRPNGTGGTLLLRGFRNQQPSWQPLNPR